MKRINILNGIAFAVIASLICAILLNLLPLLFSLTNGSTLTIAAISLGYLIYLCRYSEIRQGRVVVFAAWMAIQIGAWLFGLSLFTQLALNLTTLWLVRSLYFHSTLIAALFDLALTVMAGGAAVWALLQTGSATAAVWIFFLCQSLFVEIEKLTPTGRKTVAEKVHPDRFQAAHRAAEDAVRKLSLN